VYDFDVADRSAASTHRAQLAQRGRLLTDALLRAVWMAEELRKDNDHARTLRAQLRAVAFKPP